MLFRRLMGLPCAPQVGAAPLQTPAVPIPGLYIELRAVLRKRKRRSSPRDKSAERGERAAREDGDGFLRE